MNEYLSKILEAHGVFDRDGLSKRTAAGRAARADGPLRSAEFRRIRDMPRRALNVTTELAHEVSVALRKTSSKVEINALQAAAILEFAERGSIMAGFNTGEGKTFLGPILPLARDDVRTTGFLVPPALKSEVNENVIPFLRENFDLKPVTVVSYSELSVEYVCPPCKNAGKKRGRKKEGDQPCERCLAGILGEYDFDLVVADESHMISSRYSGRGMNFRAHMKARNRMFVPMSGSFWTKSLRDAHSIVMLTHPVDCPLPRVYPEVEDWANALDSRVPEDLRLPPGVLVELDLDPDKTCAHDYSTDDPLTPGAKIVADCLDCGGSGTLSELAQARRGVRRRFADTPGWIASTDDSFGASLVVRAVSPPVPASVEDALGRLRSLWVTPGGEEVTDPIAFWNSARNLAMGFYYKWMWPNDEIDFEWLERRRDWHRAVREVIKRNIEGVRTPLQVWNACAAWSQLLPKTLKKETLEAKHGWEEVMDRPEPPVEAVWIDDYLVRWTNAWLTEKPGLAWYSKRAFAAKYKELTLGVHEVITSGRNQDQRIRELASKPGASSILASLKAHGTGKNLQIGWSRMLHTSPPNDGQTWQQSVARIHRRGQLEPEVWVDAVLNTEELREAMSTAVGDARFVAQTQKQTQKLLQCTNLGWKR